MSITIENVYSFYILNVVVDDLQFTKTSAKLHWPASDNISLQIQPWSRRIVC